MVDMRIPIIVIDDTPIKRRGVCEFVEETPLLHLSGQAVNMGEAIKLTEELSQQQIQNPTLSNWLVLSDLRLGNDNGIELGRALLEIAPGLRVVIYTKSLAGRWLPRCFARNIRGAALHVKRTKGQKRHRDCMAMPFLITSSQRTLSVSR